MGETIKPKGEKRGYAFPLFFSAYLWENSAYLWENSAYLWENSAYLWENSTFESVCKSIL